VLRSSTLEAASRESTEEAKMEVFLEMAMAREEATQLAATQEEAEWVMMAWVGRRNTR
jgi:hypothetical protein